MGSVMGSFEVGSQARERKADGSKAWGTFLLDEAVHHMYRECLGLICVHHLCYHGHMHHAQRTLLNISISPSLGQQVLSGHRQKMGCLASTTSNG